MLNSCICGLYSFSHEVLIHYFFPNLSNQTDFVPLHYEAGGVVFDFGDMPSVISMFA